jgi:UDP-glucuronate 4-epimerase
MKKIIITGSSGFIGSNLVEYLFKNPAIESTLTTEFEVIGIDRLPFPRKIEVRKDQNFKTYVQDINDPLPDITNVYAVIHLAGRAGVRKSHEEFEEYVKDNIIGTKHILDKCASNWKPKIFLYSSSSSIYGDSPTKVKESTPSHPTSPYALTKIACEKLIEMYKNNSTLKDTSCSILRFYTVYGPYQREGLAIRNFIMKMLKDEPITVYGDGTQSRDFLFIDDLNEAIRKILIHSFPIDGIFNLSSGNPKTINEIIHWISLYMNKPVTIKYEQMNIFDVKHTSADINAFCHLTGWTPKVDIKEGIKMEIEWAKKEMKE